jgi:hypothetical protein
MQRERCLPSSVIGPVLLLLAFISHKLLVHF